MTQNKLARELGALLFVANEPLSTEQLATFTGHDTKVVESTLTELSQTLGHTGIQLTQLHGHYRLVTAPDTDKLVRQYLEADSRSDLSKAALETLAIIAYRGPITRAALDEIRGVASDTMLRNLLQRGLIAEHGTAKQPGRPMLYAVSHSFLQHFGLSSLGELPPLEEAEA